MTQKIHMVEWPGGDRPVPEGTPVIVKYRQGQLVFCSAGDMYSNRWRNGREPSGNDIVAYAVAEIVTDPAGTDLSKVGSDTTPEPGPTREELVEALRVIAGRSWKFPINTMSDWLCLCEGDRRAADLVARYDAAKEPAPASTVKDPLTVHSSPADAQPVKDSLTTEKGADQ